MTSGTRSSIDCQRRTRRRGGAHPRAGALEDFTHEAERVGSSSTTSTQMSGSVGNSAGRAASFRARMHARTGVDLGVDDHHRQLDAERGPLPLSRAERRDAAAVQLDDPPRDRQAQPEAARVCASSCCLPGGSARRGAEENPRGCRCLYR